eukprot:TRINITY_DN25333_c0_g1_i2.p1 TRINITY_DN25333_c0_g1~~TRINITY_DN25333_c0_g1_i2.p1  ORF type:complete len:273 (-),score=55.32 TRINITY_DN25333_c0_g1_i2:94-912(-)
MLRTNTLKATRLELLENLNRLPGVRAVPTPQSPWGIWLPDGRPPGGGVWQLPGFSEGLFEVQDEGSQLIALASEACPGDLVVDYCAGRGGKMWALASLLGKANGGGGRVRGWDIDADLRKQLRGARAERAGAAAFTEAPDERPHPDSCLADVVLVDAPCSSSGALRRHPSQRWAFEESTVSEIAALQRQILEEAALLVKPGGRLVYATCSLLQEENDCVADAFEEANGDFEAWPFSERRELTVGSKASHRRLLLPHIDGTDGFFMCRWKRKL